MSVPDLSQLRGPARQSREGAVVGELQKLGLVCPCGQRITLGLQVFGTWSGLVGGRPVALVAHATFCGKHCAEYRKVLTGGLPFELGPTKALAEVIASRSTPKVDWLQPVQPAA